MSEVELSRSQNVAFGKLSQRVLYVGVLFVAMGVVRLITGVIGVEFNFETIMDVVDAILLIVIGVVLYRPADNFKRIVTSAGKDISELMTAVTELGSGFRIVLVLFVIKLIVLIVEMVLDLAGAL